MDTRIEEMTGDQTMTCITTWQSVKEATVVVVGGINMPLPAQICCRFRIHQEVDQNPQELGDWLHMGLLA